MLNKVNEKYKENNLLPHYTDKILYRWVSKNKDRLKNNTGIISKDE